MGCQACCTDPAELDLCNAHPGSLSPDNRQTSSRQSATHPSKPLGALDEHHACPLGGSYSSQPVAMIDVWLCGTVSASAAPASSAVQSYQPSDDLLPGPSLASDCYQEQ